MARKEPLLSALKGGVLRLREGGGPCTDTSPHLTSLCQLLESILRKGLQQPAWGFRRRDYWHWLEQLPTGTSGGPTPLSASIQQAGSCQGVRTAQGRGRHFLRLALQRKVLAAAVQQLAQTPRLLEFYDPVSSILGNEDLLEPFLSLLLVMTEMDFSLDLQNCSFLDESWLLPVCITYETVPCRALGMVLRYVDGRVFVTEVLPESQAEVDEVVLAGDILDEINGCSLRNAYNGQAGAMLQKLKGQPLSFRLLRWRWHDGEVYEPLLPYLKVLKEKEPQFQLQRGPRHRSEGEPWGLHGGRLLYNLRYLGQTSVGKCGGKEVLDRAIPTVLERHAAAREVLFDVKEAEVLIREKPSSKLLCRYPYPTISCVGRCMDSSNVFAFCVAASPESPDRSTFDCLVFASSSEQECEEIIRRIAAGFKHTEWFV
uniref:RUN domain-containing protein n=1 Tax=Falco tinnunculus TaxID=100819 RepID=A0A8C4UNK5_FALTI